MPDPIWRPVDDALERAAAAGRHIDVWLRDDDAVEPTPALDRLIALCERNRMPILLAIVPAPATEGLARLLRAHPDIAPAQHGWSHRNHASPPERARELGARPTAEVMADLRRGRERFDALFGAPAKRFLVPPWNRIDPVLLPELPGLGFAALSTFGPSQPVPGLAVLNSDLDIIDWRGGRIGRPQGELISKLTRLIAARADTGDPVGLLTHHLAHDDAAWAFLETCLERLVRHPAVRFEAAGRLIGSRAV